MNNKLPPTPPPSRDPTGGDKQCRFCAVYLFFVIISLFLLLVLSSYPAQASEQCKDWATASEKIMTARQEHENKDAMLDRLNKANLPEQMVKDFTSLIEAAYSIPVYPRIKDKIFVIDKFGTDVFIMCLNSSAEKI